jgi:hypothetical protein
VVHFGDQQVFHGATTYTCLLFLEKGGANSCRVTKVTDLMAWRNDGTALTGDIPAENIGSEDWNFTVGRGADLFEKLRQMPVKLGDVAERIFQGLKTSADKIYIVEEIKREKNRVKVYSREKENEYWLEPDLLHQLIKGGDSKRFSLFATKRLILFPYKFQGDRVRLITESDFNQNYPLTWAYLLNNKNFLENREKGKMHGQIWYGYIYPKALDVMQLPKLFTPDIAAKSSFSLDSTGEVFFTGGVAGGYGILISPDYSREYILGLINSKFLKYLSIELPPQCEAVTTAMNLVL